MKTSLSHNGVRETHARAAVQYYSLTIMRYTGRTFIKNHAKSENIEGICKRKKNIF